MSESFDNRRMFNMLTYFMSFFLDRYPSHYQWSQIPIYFTPMWMFRAIVTMLVRHSTSPSIDYKSSSSMFLMVLTSLVCPPIAFLAYFWANFIMNSVTCFKWLYRTAMHCLFSSLINCNHLTVLPISPIFVYLTDHRILAYSLISLLVHNNIQHASYLLIHFQVHLSTLTAR